MTTPTSKSTKSPAFQFYPGDFLSSGHVDEMSMTERGVYITLLSRCWLDNGLSTNLGTLAKFARMKKPQFERIWGGALSQCFVERGGKFHNKRLDIERKKQQEFNKRQSDAAASRWDKHRQSGGNADAMPERHMSGNAFPSSTSTSSSSSDQNVQEKEGRPPLLEFQTVGKPSTWGLDADRVTEWQSAYPNIDVLAQCRRAASWLNANPTKRKTAGGMPRFLVNWLNNAVNRGGGSGPALAVTGTEGRGRTGVAPGQFDGIEEQD